MDIAAARRACLERIDITGEQRRSELSTVTDAWVQSLAVNAELASIGGTLLAVGGYGRGELSPGSDLDLLLVHPNTAQPSAVARVADAIWYPIWDAGLALDHSVRTFAESRRLASSELKVVLGLLDARTVAGDVALGEQVRSAVLADWRSVARSRMGELRAAVVERTARAGELAHLLEPDLKESYGGLRDATILRCIAAGQVTDYPHAPVVHARRTLLDVRDALQQLTGRSSDRLSMQEQAAVAAHLGIASDDELLRTVSAAGRAIAYAADTTWHRVQRLTRPPSRLRRLRTLPTPERVPLADGVVAQHDEVFLARDARPDRDPVLVLRAAAAAAQAGMRLAPETIDRLARESAVMPEPWPRAAREHLVSLLGAGPDAIPVWEALDQAGLMTRLLPHWSVVRSAPQRNALHIHTVDRHSVETAARAAASARDVRRPDLLLVAALFHDIGKARGPGHSCIGAELMQNIAPRLGFPPADTETLVRLVEHHLLLVESATRRDPGDPATTRAIADAVGSGDVLDLLHHLTMADSLATAPGVWSDWKARLIDDLVRATRAVLTGAAAPARAQLVDELADLAQVPGTQVRVRVGAADVRVDVVTADRPGLLATVAGVLTLQRLDVRAARVQTVAGRALQSWVATTSFGDAPAVDALREDLLRAIAGSVDVDERIARRVAPRPARRGFIPPAPVVRFLPAASAEADVLEVRAHDAPALLWRVARAVADAGATVLSAHVSTLGSEAIDVLYLRRADGDRLSVPEQATIVAAIDL